MVVTPSFKVDSDRGLGSHLGQLDIIGGSVGIDKRSFSTVILAEKY